MKVFKITSLILFAVGILFFEGAVNANAANIGDVVNFNVDKSFDASGRTKLSATLIKITPKLYFYVEKSWWDAKDNAARDSVLSNLDILSNEFSTNIYPRLTNAFGYEWIPGIDRDEKITVLFEPMNSMEGGYFREMDEYEKLQLPDSNEREMVYLSISNIESANLKIVLAHEFTHLITFNQKNKINNVEEDTWLNEGRADYSSTLLGYDNKYEGSNLQQRVKDFIENPSDSITDWSGTKYDYASVSMFMHYLVNHYGVSILENSIKSKLVGIDSINKALLDSGLKDDFAKIFTNWTIALTISDCSQNNKYCYSNENLANLKINPTLIFLPLSGNSSLSTTNVTKNWAGNWQKIIGGNGNLKLSFSNLSSLNFQVPYIVFDKSGSYSVNFLQFNADKKGEINIPEFGSKYKSLIVIPSLQTKISSFENLDLIFPYSFTVSIVGQNSDADQELIQQLLDKIAELKREIARILGQTDGSAGQTACGRLDSNLYFGLSNNSQVSCLQEFLKNQGQDIYPEGLVTGNFGSLTQQAVIRFQAKNGIPTTGFVGPLTRAKINQ